jgi:hypothetical protein
MCSRIAKSPVFINFQRAGGASPRILKGASGRRAGLKGGYYRFKQSGIHKVTTNNR